MKFILAGKKILPEAMEKNVHFVRRVSPNKVLMCLSFNLFEKEKFN